MGKRKRKFENSLNSDILNLLEYELCEIEELIDDMEAYYATENIEVYPWQHPDHGRKALSVIRQLHDILETRLPVDDVSIEPCGTEHKGKGKLNLHETDKEIRDRLLKFKEDDWG